VSKDLTADGSTLQGLHCWKPIQIGGSGYFPENKLSWRHFHRQLSNSHLPNGGEDLIRKDGCGYISIRGQEMSFST
jgi:hypothetical protein